MLLRLTACALMTLSLLACAHHLLDPADGPAATILFRSETGPAQPLVCQSGAGFRATPASLSADRSGWPLLQELNASLNKADQVSVRVATDGPVTVAIRQRAAAAPGQSAPRCTPAARFTPTPEQTYVVTLVASGRWCGLQVQTAGGEPVDDAVPVRARCP